MELQKIGALLAKIEGTYATDPTPTAAANNIGIIRGTIPTEPTGDVIDRDILDQGHCVIPGSVTMLKNSIKFRTELRGNYVSGSLNTDISSGKSTNAIEIDCLLRGCDLIPTYTAQLSESGNGSRDGYVIYAPALPTASAVGPSVTFYAYSQTKVYKAVGCKGNIAAITLEAGKYGYIDWEFSGKFIAVADAAVSGLSLTFLQTKPPVFASATATHTLTLPPFTTYSLKLGNNIITRADCQDTSVSLGLHSFAVSYRDSKLDIDPESKTEATVPFWAAWQARTNQTLTLAYGSQSGNKIQIATTQNVDAIKYSDRNNNRIQGISCSLRNPTIGVAYGTDLQLKFS